MGAAQYCAAPFLLIENGLQEQKGQKGRKSLKSQILLSNFPLAVAALLAFNHHQRQKKAATSRLLLLYPISFGYQLFSGRSFLTVSPVRHNSLSRS